MSVIVNGDGILRTFWRWVERPCSKTDRPLSVIEIVLKTLTCDALSNSRLTKRIAMRPDSKANP